MSDEIKQLISDAEVDAAVKEALERGLNIQEAISDGKRERNKILNVHLILIGLLLVGGVMIIWGTLEDNKIKTTCTVWYRDSPFYFDPENPVNIDFLQWRGNESYRDNWSEIKYKEVLK